MNSGAIADWLPILVLAGIAMLFAVLFMRSRFPWFAGAPLAGIIAIVLFELIGHFILDQPDKFLYIALFFGGIYATGFALIPYVARYIFGKFRKPRLSQ